MNRAAMRRLKFELRIWTFYLCSSVPARCDLLHFGAGHGGEINGEARRPDGCRFPDEGHPGEVRAGDLQAEGMQRNSNSIENLMCR